MQKKCGRKRLGRVGDCPTLFCQKKKSGFRPDARNFCVKICCFERTHMYKSKRSNWLFRTKINSAFQPNYNCFPSIFDACSLLEHKRKATETATVLLLMAHVYAWKLRRKEPNVHATVDFQWWKQTCYSQRLYHLQMIDPPTGRISQWFLWQKPWVSMDGCYNTSGRFGNSCCRVRILNLPNKCCWKRHDLHLACICGNIGGFACFFGDRRPTLNSQLTESLPLFHAPKWWNGKAHHTYCKHAFLAF